MNRFRIKEQMRKMKWATEHSTGKRLGKKGLIEVQKVVMEMNSTITLPEPAKANWQERKPKAEPIKMTVDLTKLIGNKF